MKRPYGFPLVSLVAATLILLSSCVTQKQVKYLQKQQENDTVSVYKPKDINYRLQPKDNLYIKIYSMDEKSYFFFNRQGETSSGDYTSDLSVYLNSYTVNDSGYIDFPLLGNVLVRDKTVDEIKRIVKTRIGEYLKDPSVIVKIVNFNVTVVGEVRKPGELKIYQDKINIFEAVSMAGDMTDFADRGKVALIRHTPTGSKIIYLDMNSQQILNSEYFYMQPNDIIYVAPLGIKRWGSETFPWALVFAAITTALLLLNYFK